MLAADFVYMINQNNVTEITVQVYINVMILHIVKEEVVMMRYAE